MKNYLKGMISGILIVVLIMGMVPAFATTMTRTIQAVFNDYQVYINGAKVKTTSEPFMVGGVAYISANDAAKMMGKSLHVSGQQILIGEASGISTREFLTQSYEKVGNIYAGITWVSGDVEIDRSGSILEDARNYATVYFYVDGSLAEKEEVYRGQDPIKVSLDLSGARPSHKDDA